MLRLSLLLALSTLMLGCSTQFPLTSKEPMSNNDKAYLEATMLPRLIIPEDLKDKTRLTPLYPIPAGALPEPGSKAVSALPPGLNKVPATEVEVKEVEVKKED